MVEFSPFGVESHLPWRRCPSELAAGEGAPELRARPPNVKGVRKGPSRVPINPLATHPKIVNPAARRFFSAVTEMPLSKKLDLAVNLLFFILILATALPLYRGSPPGPQRCVSNCVNRALVIRHRAACAHDAGVRVSRNGGMWLTDVVELARCNSLVQLLVIPSSAPSLPASPLRSAAQPAPRA